MNSLCATVKQEFPTAHQLQAAARVLCMIGENPVIHVDLQASYSSVATGLILSSHDLQHAEKWLLSHHWLSLSPPFIQLAPKARGLSVDTETSAKDLLRKLLMDSLPLWLRMAVIDGRVRQELIPERVIETLSRVFPAREEREALLIAAGLRFDADLLRRIGDVGEDAVMKQCQSFLVQHDHPELARLVRRVSLLSDQLGYDIVSPNLAGVEIQLEVKCFSGRRPDFYLTRNEYEVGVRLRNWALVLCRMDGYDDAEVVGWTTLDPMRESLPLDRDLSVAWQTARVRLDWLDVHPGLPLGLTDPQGKV